MTDTNTGLDDLKARVQDLVRQLKDELAQRLDQFLDELGARVGSDDDPDVHPPQPTQLPS